MIFDFKKKVPDDSHLGNFISKQKDKNILFLQKHMGLSKDQAEDIFQDSSVAFVYNIKNGKFTNQGASLSTYLIQICKNQASKFIRTKKRMPKVEIEKLTPSAVKDRDDWDDQCIDELLDDTIPDREERDNFLDSVEFFVKQLPEPCKTLLWGRYWDNLSHKELADMLGYKSANTSKTQTSRCLDKFKAKVEPYMPNLI